MVQLITDFSIVICAFFSPHREDLCECEHKFVYTNRCLCLYFWIPSFHFFLPVGQEVD